MRRLLVGMLALGACALAPTAQAAPSVNTDAVKVKDYQMTLSVAKSGGAYALTVMMNRTAGTSSQLHIWSFPLSGKAVKLTGTTFKIDTGTELGRYGKVKLTLGQTTLSRTNLPCFGSVSNRRGAITGTVKLTLDSAYFKNVTRRPTKAGIAGTLPQPKPNCGANQGGGNGGQNGMLTLSAFPAGGGLEGGVMLSASKDAKGAVTHSATMMASGAEIAPATSVMHMVSAQAGAEGLVAADDLATASAAFASPFLGGSLAFAAMEGTNTPANAFGDLTGSLQVKFDSPGVQTVTALQGSLQRS